MDLTLNDEELETLLRGMSCALNERTYPGDREMLSRLKSLQDSNPPTRCRYCDGLIPETPPFCPGRTSRLGPLPCEPLPETPLDAVIDLVERGGNLGEVVTLCEYLRDFPVPLSTESQEMLDRGIEDVKAGRVHPYRPCECDGSGRVQIPCPTNKPGCCVCHYGPCPECRG